jgi:hypothetical protein
MELLLATIEAKLTLVEDGRSARVTGAVETEDEAHRAEAGMNLASKSRWTHMRCSQPLPPPRSWSRRARLTPDIAAGVVAA